MLLLHRCTFPTTRAHFPVAFCSPPPSLYHSFRFLLPILATVVVSCSRKTSDTSMIQSLKQFHKHRNFQSIRVWVTQEFVFNCIHRQHVTHLTARDSSQGHYLWHLFLNEIRFPDVSSGQQLPEEKFCNY